ncbi:hypothetical protein FQR65_LT02547 [Abscondita terminalis]|nr:hypothetical protein FQR65_LT02547 [Abscondita terminalis]
MNNLTTDANTLPSPSTVTNQIYSFTIHQVAEIEDALDLMEKVSLVFLLYEQAELALQYVTQLINGVPLNVIVEWAQVAVKIRNWHDKLVEALSIIQNFSIIIKLGYNKKEVCDRFLPMNSNTSLFIDLSRKKLYRIAETMTKNQIKMFLSHVQEDFKHKNLQYKAYPLPYIEIYLLYWESIGYIGPSNLTNLSKAFKVMEMCDEADTLKDVVNLTVDNKKLYGQFVNNETISTVSTASTQQGHIRNNNYGDSRYFIDPKYPGICLIINQENFYTEPDPEWAHLLPKDNIELYNRDGTIFDCNKLKETFQMFGYTIVIKNDLTHQDLLEAVTETVNMVTNHSSFIVCILSHGLEGMVYGVNSIPVEISKIRNIICSTNTKNLRTKPKVLILQSCQGNECQLDKSMEKDNVNLEMDGGSRPKTADVLLFWATGPGFSAIRDPARGSWFIQSLCLHIQQRAHEMHFEDICTLVKQEVIDKRWKTQKIIRAMVPNKESTLSRFFFLPVKKL